MTTTQLIDRMRDLGLDGMAAPSSITPLRPPTLICRSTTA